MRQWQVSLDGSVRFETGRTILKMSFGLASDHTCALLGGNMLNCWGGAHLGVRLGEAEDVVDEKQHVLALLVTEVLRNGEA